MKSKTKLRLLALVAVALAAASVSCTPVASPPAAVPVDSAASDSWPEAPNPLDTPFVARRTPIAEGRFGHSNKGITW